LIQRNPPSYLWGIIEVNTVVSRAAQIFTLDLGVRERECLL